MTLGQIIALARRGLDDETEKDSKRGWGDPELAEYATDAERELARRLYLLNDSDTIGYLNLSGSGGQVSNVSVSGVAITSGVVAFTSDLQTTATALAANITAMASTPKYRAVSRGPYVVVKANPGTGYPTTGYVLSAVVSGGTLAAAATTLTGLCRHVLSVGNRFLAMHSKVVRITRFKPASETQSLGITTKEEMDYRSPGWEEYENGTPIACIPNYKRKEIVIAPPPDVIDLIEADCDRLPLFDLTAEDMNAIPEIGEEYHRDMVWWIKRQAYLKNDVEVRDFNRSLQAEKEFDRIVENWKIEDIRREPNCQTNRIPGGFL